MGKSVKIGWLKNKFTNFIEKKNLLEHRTDGSDAFDTLYIGCEKFPQADISPVAVDTGGIM